MGAYASGLDRHSYKVKAGGSNPPVPTSCRSHTHGMNLVDWNNARVWTVKRYYGYAVRVILLIQI